MNSDKNNIRPLIVELDQCLVQTNILWESCLLFIKKYPLRIFSLIKWIILGKDYLNYQLSVKIIPNVDLLPYSEDVINLIKTARASGRKIYLFDRSNQIIADKILTSTNLFTAVINHHHKGNKRDQNVVNNIRNNTGSEEFDFVGNMDSDLKILDAAKTIYLYTNSNRPPKSINKINNNLNLIKQKNTFLQRWMKALRVHQWAKNVLIFLALFMSHRIFETDLFIKSVIAFLSFSFSASSVYILNDLFDLESDRQHPSKRHRPFASGQISIKNGMLAVPILLLTSFLLSMTFLPNLFTLILLIYLLVTTGYSIILKEILFLDVILLGALYTLRIIAGGLATGIEVSSWLLGFSGFFFLSLAFMKRYTDLVLFKKNSQEELFGRGYNIDDTEIVQKAGITSGFLSLIILALYITSDQVFILYQQPLLLWLSIPIILYWLMNMWFVAGRGKMNEDPIIYAVKDKISYISFAMLLLVIITATIL